MFPYLRDKNSFLEECRRVSYEITGENTEDGNEYIIKELSDKGDYRNIRGCNIDQKLCRECNGCSIHRSCYEYRDDARYDHCKECKNISDMTAWLINNVDMASWSNSDGKNKVGSVSFGEIHAWCQSNGIYMHDILSQVNTDNLMVGLEYYKEQMGDDNNVRTDMILAGYNSDRKPTLVVIELKQYDAVYFNNVNKENYNITTAAGQVSNYVKSIRASIDDEDFQRELEIIPCVYYHNLSTNDFYLLKDSVRASNLIDIEKVGDYNENIFNSNKDEDCAPEDEVRIFYRNSRMDIFLNDCFTDSEDSDDAIDIIRDLKKYTKTISSEELSDIFLGSDESWNDDKWKEQLSILRPDQKNVFDRLIKEFKIEESDNTGVNKKRMYIINGSSGSGKTLIAAMLIRWCMKNGKRVALLYQGTAPIYKYFSEKMGTEGLKLPSKDEEDIRRGNGSLKVTYYSNLKEEVGDGVNINDYDLIIFDEFHRFNGKVEQLDDLFGARNNIIMIDRLQGIYPEDKGEECVDKILEDARFDTQVYDLWSHFRCNFDEGYITWIENALGIAGNTRGRLRSQNIYLEDLDFDVEIVSEEDINVCLNQIIAPQNEGSEIYLLSEVDPDEDGAIPGIDSDMRFVKYNRKGVVESTGHIYESVNEDGSVNILKSVNVQGVEFDNIFVIIDNRLTVNDGNVELTDEDNQDGIDLELILRRYRILLTRGLKKCYIYAIDRNMRKHLESKITRNKNLTKRGS